MNEERCQVQQRAEEQMMVLNEELEQLRARAGDLELQLKEACVVILQMLLSIYNMLFTQCAYDKSMYEMISYACIYIDVSRFPTLLFFGRCGARSGSRGRGLRG